ncbi:hypothetical protein Bca52824_090342 [Brassica carinata]|uniref:Chloride channel protein n=4 Tax=Brassica TaxID=3705 RepID=A0A8X7NYA0_BRACI|nr:hypothetical protein Bca52824_090342 [Brassica carinata]
MAAATPALCAALRSPFSPRRFSPIRETTAPLHFGLIPSSLFRSVATGGGRLFPRSLATKQQVDAGFDQPPSQELAIVSACLVGVLTGISVVLFNNCVHLLRDLSWDGIPDRGASWLRDAPIGSVWLRVILVPTLGGLLVSVLNNLREAAEDSDTTANANANANAVLRPFLKAVAACVTLGTGNSLGPEGPSVEIGASIARGVNSVFNKSPQTGLSLLAAGSASGISSGFNAAVAGCFFAVESVLWPSSSDSSTSLPNSTSMVILSAVIASVVSEIGLGSEPAFKVPDYDFRSPGELPLYLLLGALCGLVSLALSRCTSSMTSAVDSLNKDAGIPKSLFPVLGGLTVGIIALVYPEVLYWGFENVDILLESRPFVKGLSADLLLQLVAVKIAATALCRASGLVGGYYAPSLFIGGAAGMAYGKFIGIALAQNPGIHLSILEVASPQAYGLVGMAATLAGVCQVPLTSVLLLFELTQDYRIVLPLLGAVGMSSWITSGQSKRQETRETKETRKRNSQEAVQSLTSSDEDEPSTNNLCEVESSLCVDDSSIQAEELQRSIFVSEAMRTRFATVMMSTSLEEAVTRMLIEKQSCALIVDPDNIFLGLLTLSDILEFSKARKEGNKEPKEYFVNEICSMSGGCRVPWTVTPDMDLLAAQTIMNKHEISHVPVVSGGSDSRRIHPVGVLDKECITVTRRYAYIYIHFAFSLQKMDQPKGKVCVTGASGFLASWLVKRLLLAASSPLHKSLCIHFIDILLTLISCDMIGGDFETSYESLKGVVLTSSSSTVRIRDDFDPNIPLDESVWTSVELCKRFQVWYALSKTLAEQAAWKFCEENSIDLVTVLPSFLVGPSLPPDLCSTASDVLGLLKGETEKFQWHGQMGYVHIDDVARTHILVFEHEAAGGRYICSSNVVSLEELVSFLSTRYPSLHIPERFEKLNRLHYDFDTSKIKSLGLKFKSLEEMFDDCIASFVEKGYLSHVVTSQ